VPKLDPRVEWVEGGGGNSPSGMFIGPDAVASGVFAGIGANFDEYHVVLDTGFEHVFDNA
jgi:hypothetical protein